MSETGEGGLMKKRHYVSVLVWLAALPFVAFAAETITYTYDAQGRLVAVNHAGTVNDNIQTNYSFDDADNRHSVKTTGAP
jgi:hypothetical protein